MDPPRVFKKPRKSILKMRENATAPLPPVLEKPAPAYRRVSFAEKVHLHQIELVPVDGLFQSAHDSDLDSPDDASFGALEADADQVLTALKTGLMLELTSSDSEEETMELTGQIQPVAGGAEELDMELTAQVSHVAQFGEMGNDGALGEPGDEGSIETGEAEKGAEREEASEDGTSLHSPASNSRADITETAPDLAVVETAESQDLATQEVTMELTQPVLGPAEVALGASANAETPGSDHKHLPNDNGQVSEAPTTPAAEAPDGPTQEESPEEPRSFDDLFDEETSMVLTQQISLPGYGSSDEGQDSRNGRVDSPVSSENENVDSQNLPKKDGILAESVDAAETVAETAQDARMKESEDTSKSLKEPLDAVLSTEPANPEPFVEDSKKAVDSQLALEALETAAPGTPKATNLQTPVKSINTLEAPQLNSISLTDFLAEIGVKFYDDLEIVTDLSTRYRTSNGVSGLQFEKEDYYRANIHLPLLEVYELSCKELAGKIQQGKDLFDELKEKTVQENPDLFHEYFSATYYDQMAMKARFHVLKEYTRQQARQVWYEWRTKLVQNIHEVLENNMDILQSEKAALQESISIIDASHAETRQRMQDLRKDIQKFKEIKDNFKDMDVDLINLIKARMTRLNKQLIDHKNLVLEKEHAVKSLESEISEQNAVLHKLRAEISAAEDKVNKTRHFNGNEIDTLQVHSKILQACAGLKFTRAPLENIYEFEFNPKMGIKIDMTKADSAEGLVFQPLSSSKQVLYNEGLMEFSMEYLAETMQFTNIFDTLRSFRRKWLQLVAVDEEIYKLSLKYPLKIDQSRRGLIQFTFVYLSQKSKVQIAVSVPLDAIIDFPECAKIEAHVFRSHEQTEKEVRESLSGSRVQYAIFSKKQPIRFVN